MAKPKGRHSKMSTVKDFVGERGSNTPSVAIWWSREKKLFIAVCPRYPQAIGVSENFVDAAKNLDIAIKDLLTHTG